MDTIISDHDEESFKSICPSAWWAARGEQRVVSSTFPLRLHAARHRPSTGPTARGSFRVLPLCGAHCRVCVTRWRTWLNNSIWPPGGAIPPLNALTYLLRHLQRLLCQWCIRGATVTMGKRNTFSPSLKHEERQFFTCLFAVIRIHTVPCVPGIRNLKHIALRVGVGLCSMSTESAGQNTLINDSPTVVSANTMKMNQLNIQ